MSVSTEDCCVNFYLKWLFCCHDKNTIIFWPSKMTFTHLRSSFARRNFSSKWAISSHRAAFSCQRTDAYYKFSSHHVCMARRKSFRDIFILNENKLTKIMARAVLRSLRYLSRYFSFWFFRRPRFTFGLGSDEPVGEGKAWAELPDPELEPRKDWAAKACSACWRSSVVWEKKVTWHMKHLRLVLTLPSWE